MQLIVTSLEAESKMDEFRKHHNHVFFLGSENQSANNFYSVDLDFLNSKCGLGVATAIGAVKPKAIFVDGPKTVIVGFDSFISAVSFDKISGLATASRTIKLDAVFVDMVFLENKNICVIHELGAEIITPELTNISSVTTDLISDWDVDQDHRIFSLTEAESGAVIRFSSVIETPAHP